MGRSAKICKRPKSKKIKSSSNTAGAPSIQIAPPLSTHATAKAATAKKKAGLKNKAKAGTTIKYGDNNNSHLLNGADYVGLLLGSRKEAKQEAKKLTS